MDLFAPVARPCTDKVLGELPREWTWIAEIGQRGLWPNGHLTCRYAPDEYCRQQSVERRRIRRIWAAVRAGVLESATQYRTSEPPRVLILRDGEREPTWVKRHNNGHGIGSCCVVRLRSAA